MTGKKRGSNRAMHPENKYAENPPDFSLLASQYPSFKEYVTYNSYKRPRIDWTDFNATRELTRVLLEHDYGIKWWIPDGQLCPTVPNRANYIHWIEDLLSVSPAPWHVEKPTQVRGVDIGTGANCIYPLLGAALNGWHFVATDVTPVALEWAQWNVQDNPQLSGCIEVRPALLVPQDGKVESIKEELGINTVHNQDAASQEAAENGGADADADHTFSKTPVLERPHGFSADEDFLLTRTGDEAVTEKASEDLSGPCRSPAIEDNQQPQQLGDADDAPSATNMDNTAGNPPLLVGVVQKSEKFDFCMCNPPFFESMEEAGLNPRTACGGTVHEMVYPGGELAFITKMVEDSMQLQRQIHWYTSMVGRKVNVKLLTTILRDQGVTMLRTTEFVQGRTSRWGIAWSFSPVQNPVASVPGRSLEKSNISFMLEGIGSKCSAWDVLQALANQLRDCGATANVDSTNFSIMGTLSKDGDDEHDHNGLPNVRMPEDTGSSLIAANSARKGGSLLPFRASVFQQVPGTLVIKASISKADGPSGAFSTLFGRVEFALKEQFLRIPTKR